MACLCHCLVECQWGPITESQRVTVNEGQNSEGFRVWYCHREPNHHTDSLIWNTYTHVTRSYEPSIICCYGLGWGHRSQSLPGLLALVPSVSDGLFWGKWHDSPYFFSQTRRSMMQHEQDANRCLPWKHEKKQFESAGENITGTWKLMSESIIAEALQCLCAKYKWWTKTKFPYRGDVAKSARYKSNTRFFWWDFLERVLQWNQTVSETVSFKEL